MGLVAFTALLLVLVLVLVGSSCCQSTSNDNYTTIWINLLTVTDLSTINWQYDGYLFAVNFANSKNDGRGVYLGNHMYYKFNLTGVNDGANYTWSKNELGRRLNSKEYDVYLGTATVRAAFETQMGNDSGIITLLCCVGPNLVYEPDRRWVFGIQGDSADYSQNTIINARLRGAKRVGVAHSTGSAFPETLGAASIANAKDFGYELIKVRSYPTRPKVEDYYDDMDKWADEMIEAEIDLFVGATIVEDGNAWYDTFTRKKYPLKGFFLSVMADNNFFAAKGAPAQYITSGYQWDETMKAYDPFFGSTKDVANNFRKYIGYGINYSSASSIATIYALVMGINQTFYGKVDATTDLFSPQNNEQLRYIMSLMDIDSFFGQIAFDRLRRNRKETVTIQNIQMGSGAVVLPVQQSAVEFVYPIPGTLFVKWSDPAGIFLGAITTAALASCVVIGIVLFMFRQVSKASSPMFNIASILGAMVSASTLYLLPGIPNDDSCNGVPWIYVIGMTLLIAPILAKTFRIRIIVNSMEKMRVVKVKDTELLIWITSLLFINISVLSFWMGISKLYQKNAKCVSDNTDAFIITFIVIGVIYIVILCVFAFQVRKFVSDFSDTAILTFAGAYLLIMIVIFVPLVFYVDLDNQPAVHLLLVVAGVLFPSVGVVYILYLPVIYVVFFVRGMSDPNQPARSGPAVSMSPNVAKYTNKVAT